MREHFTPQDGVHTYNTRLSSTCYLKGKIVWFKIILLQWVFIMELITTCIW